MKKYLLTIPCLILTLSGFSQEKIINKIKEAVTQRDAEAHLTFLASDEMRGRDTGSPEIAIAANYLAAQFKMLGLKPAVPGGYFQEVGLQQTLPPRTLTLKLGNDLFHFKDDLLLLKGKSFNYDGEMVFVGYGRASDFNGIDVKGKVVVSYAGMTDSSNLRQALRKEGPLKYKMVKEKGGVALIEILNIKEAPWPVVSGFLSGARISLAEENDQSEETSMPHIWINSSSADGLAALVRQKMIKGNLVVDASGPRVVAGKNVVGIIEGTDPQLRQEYIVLSAHYDHVGVKKNETADSIYNGARDNAIGTTAILEAAKFLVQNPVKRSVIILAFCAEEKGLLGSRWYSDHPLIPLSKTVFNLDCDGAGYNDKTIANLVDLNRTSADELLKKGCEAFGLGLKGDPAPDQNLYERSDNYNFAVKGVPAVDFSPGVKGLDAELMKYYHQPPDEVASLDLEYVEKFLRAYVYSAYLVGNAPTKPVWKAGDKFEEAGKKLYQGK